MDNTRDTDEIGFGNSAKTEDAARGEGIVLSPEVTIEEGHSGYSPIRSRWKENHGNLLMAFVGLILLFGSGLLVYRQTRFVPPRFPESDMITPPPIEVEGLGGQPNPDDLIVIRVTGAATDIGSIRIAIYDREVSFNNPDEALATNSLSLTNGEATWVIPVAGLPEKLSIACYHDENDDGQLNLNRFGIPSERYGFSRNARGLTGPPSFQQTLIDRPRGGETLDLFIR